jgi:hypothetical protein
MRMVKSVLLGSAAGLVAVTAGQAADLPVKAQPSVQYVKVCNMYGAGFYYMPGTDMCIKIGGWVRAEITEGTGSGSLTWGPFNGNVNNRTTNNLAERARGYITADAREQTAYGVARGYISVGENFSDSGTQIGVVGQAADSFSANRAYVQWAGFTAGLAQSFYDFYSQPAAQYRGGYMPASDTSDGGWWVWGYTAQFGGGFSGTISAETRRVTQIVNQNAITAQESVTPGPYNSSASFSEEFSAGTITNVLQGAGAYGGQQWPDVVANLRVDQAWGSAQIMGAVHNVNASYYSGVDALGSNPGAPIDGNPSNQTGWAAGAGLKINFPTIAAGDYFQSQFNYTQGALRYLFQTPNTNWGKADGSNEAYGVLSDCVYGGTVGTADTTSCQLTTAWGFNASYEHYWTPQWHQSVFGAYYVVNYNSAANAMLCSAQGNGNGLLGSAAVAVAGCNNNWSTWAVGTRLQYDVTKSFYVGVEVLYDDLRSATSGCSSINGCGVAAATTALSGTSLVESNSSDWAFTLRAHKDFLP